MPSDKFIADIHPEEKWYLLYSTSLNDQKNFSALFFPTFFGDLILYCTSILGRTIQIGSSSDITGQNLSLLSVGFPSQGVAK